MSLSDLAPTFLEAAGVKVPADVTARSLMPILLSGKSGLIDPSRDHVLTGMERHVMNGRTEGESQSVGYPMRTLITKDFHYIRNFKSDRWPAGDPSRLPLPDFEVLASSTTATFPDCDAGPTKAFMVSHAEDPAVKPFADRAFGKRPPRELYDLRQDPYELKNLAEDPQYAGTVANLDSRLMDELKASGDPRVTGSGVDLDTLQPSKPKAAPKP